MSDYIYEADDFINEKLREDFLSEKMNDELYLAHYGTKRHSGRYPYGSGDNPYQHEPWYEFMMKVNELKDSGETNSTAIAHALGMSTTEYRAKLTNASAKERAVQRAAVLRLADRGMGASAIGR